MSIFGYDFGRKDVAVALDEFARERLVQRRENVPGPYTQGPATQGSVRTKAHIVKAAETIPGGTTPEGVALDGYSDLRRMGKGKCVFYTPINEEPAADSFEVDYATTDFSLIPRGEFSTIEFSQDDVNQKQWNTERYVYNASAGAIPKGTWFTASLVQGLFIADLQYIRIFCQTPSGGIPARSGDTAGNAECTVVDLTTDGKMTSGSETVTVYNPWGADVAGSAYITASTAMHNLLIVDAEDCA